MQSEPPLTQMMQRLMLLLMVALLPALAQGQATAKSQPLGASGPAVESANDIVQRYPSGSIMSGALASAALDDVAHQRMLLTAAQKSAQQACRPVFFMTKCLEAVRERYRLDLAKLHPIEMEARSYNRRNRVRERDLALDEKRVRAEQNSTAGKGDVKIRQPSPAVLPSPSHSVPRVHQAASLTPRIDAQQQARNIAAFDRKAAQSEERQRDIAAKKLEKEQDREKKRAAAAAVP